MKRHILTCLAGLGILLAALFTMPPIPHPAGLLAFVLFVLFAIVAGAAVYVVRRLAQRFRIARVFGVLALLGICTLAVSSAWAQATGHPVEVPAALTMIPFIGDFLLGIEKWLPVIFQVIGAFSMIAALTANETDDKIVNYILKAINLLGFNFGTAKNDPTVGVNQPAPAMTSGGQTPPPAPPPSG